MTEQKPEPRVQRSRTRRWGLRSLAFLALALVGLFTAGGDYALLSAVALVVGFVGAGYCSYRGVKAFSWLPR